MSARIVGDHVAVVEIDGRRFVAHFAADRETLYLHVDGVTYHLPLIEEDDAPRRSATPDGAQRAPMPGLVTKVFVSVGQAVTLGDPLFAIEAMKMETIVHAAVEGRVAAVHVAVGEQVDAGAEGVTIS